MYQHYERNSYYFKDPTQKEIDKNDELWLKNSIFNCWNLIFKLLTKFPDQNRNCVDFEKDHGVFFVTNMTYEVVPDDNMPGPLPFAKKIEFSVYLLGDISIIFYLSFEVVSEDDFGGFQTKFS